MSDERIPVGTKVRYHGSHEYLHGEYTVLGYSDFADRSFIFTPEVIAEHYPDGFAYDIWPVGVPYKFGNVRDGYGLHFVRHKNLTVIED
jgi:hypothetical protein